MIPIVVSLTSKTNLLKVDINGHKRDIGLSSRRENCTVEMKTPPATFYLKKAVGLAPTGKPGSGSKEPGRTTVASVTMDQLREIAKLKLADLNTDDIDQGAKIIAGSARAMGIEVKG